MGREVSRTLRCLEAHKGVEVVSCNLGSIGSRRSSALFAFVLQKVLKEYSSEIQLVGQLVKEKNNCLC